MLGPNYPVLRYFTVLYLSNRSKGMSRSSKIFNPDMTSSFAKYSLSGSKSNMCLTPTTLFLAASLSSVSFNCIKIEKVNLIIINSSPFIKERERERQTDRERHTQREKDRVREREREREREKRKLV